MILKQIHKISVIGMLAVVIGIITVGPVMADKDSSEGHNKIDICHSDSEDGKFVKLSIPENKAEGHTKNHPNDIIPAPDDGCPEQEESDDSINMAMFMEDFTRHDNVISEITNSHCSLGEVVTGFGPNGELLCSPDNTGEDNPFNIISRTDTFELAPGASMHKEYFCEPGEILVGGLIEISPTNKPILNDDVIINSSVQSYIAILKTNNNPEAASVNVTYLCYGVI